MQPRAASVTASRISAASRSTRAIASIASAVPDADVIARDDVFGISRPNAATIGTTISVMRLPGTPPIECLSTTIGSPQSIRGMRRVSHARERGDLGVLRAR